MKWIKKISQTPLDTIAKVIDSLTSGDDQVKNAPSIHIVKSAIAEINNTITTLGNNITTALGTKVDKVTGKALSTNDFTDAYKGKVDESSYNTPNINQAETLSSEGHNYYSANSPYTCPHDGYVYMNVASSGFETWSIIYIKTSGYPLVQQIEANGHFREALVFVKKGMKIYAITSAEDCVVSYIPLTSYT